ncbi:MAG: OadG family protein [Clostridia bacterium]|nr:OadG family protein [Clostridia bacterium]
MDNFEFSVQVLVIGFSVVLLTLFVLYGILELFNRIFNRAVVRSAANKATAGIDSPEIFNEGLNRRTTVAITAAVYQYMQGENAYIRSGRINIEVQSSSNGSVSMWQVNGRNMLLENKSELVNIRRTKNRENI